MINSLFGIQIVNREDPLANVKSVSAWAAGLPPNDPVGAVDAIIRLLEAASATQPAVTVHRWLAVIELDRIAMPLQDQLRAQYRMPAMSDEVRQRLWRACDELARWFTHFYEWLYQGAQAAGNSRRGHAELHGVFARLFYYVGVQTRQGLFRYEQWIPGKWRQLHGAYRAACEQGVAAEPFALDPLTPAEGRLSPEQEYLQILLLQRINTGNLTAQQVDWAAEWLRGWAHLLRLTLTPLQGEGYWLDLGRGEGLVTPCPQAPAGDLLYLDAGPLREQMDVLLPRLAAQAGANPGQSEIEEQLALARRLGQFWTPRAGAQPRRGERRAAHLAVTVAAGWAEIMVALATKPAQKTGAPQGYHYDDYGRLRPDKGGVRTAGDARRMDADAWQIQDASESGFRIRSSSPHAARQRPGVLIALQPEDSPQWQLGIVRRLKRLGAVQTELGVEIITPNAMLIVARELGVGEAGEAGYSVDGVDVGLAGKSFQALYVPAQPRARAISPPSLVLPPAEFRAGRLLSLQVDGHPQDACLSAALERARDWVWTALEGTP